MRLTSTNGNVQASSEMVSSSLLCNEQVREKKISRGLARNSSVNFDILTNDAMFNVTYGSAYLLSQPVDAITTVCLLHGDINFLNLALSYISFIPLKDFNGNASLEVEYCENGGIVVGPLGAIDIPPVCVSRSMPFAVLPVNDPPYLTTPALPVVITKNAAYCFEDTLSLTDVDSTLVLLTLSTDYGTLTMRDIPVSIDLLEGTTGENDRRMSIIGSVSDINKAIRGLVYTTKWFWNSRTAGVPDIISLVAIDQNPGTAGNLTSTATIAVIVDHEYAQTPRLLLPGALIKTQPCEALTGTKYGEFECNRIVSVDVFDVKEDEPTVITGLLLVNPDSRGPLDRLLEVFVTCQRCTLSFPTAYSAGVHVSVLLMGISVRGTLSVVNDLLASLTYTPTPNFYGSDFVSFYIRYQGIQMIGELAVNRWVNETLPVHITPVPDPPRMHLPHDVRLEVREDMQHVIDGVYIIANDFMDTSSEVFDR